MDLYHLWFNLKAGERDTDFAGHFRHYMDHLQERGLITRWRLTRRKLGLGPATLPEFHGWIETDGLAQLDAAFRLVSSRSGDSEILHHGVNSRVQDVMIALYRDFPDPHRVIGDERF